MKRTMKKGRWVVGALLLVWGVLGALAESLLPALLTGNRFFDAALISAATTFLLAEMLEVFWAYSSSLRAG
jgi:hypothetical protein